MRLQVPVWQRVLGVLTLALFGAVGRSGPAAADTGGNDSVFDVSCANATSCLAVGSREDPSSGVMSATGLRWNGSSWATVSVPPVPKSATTDLLSLSCDHRLTCMAVGTVFDSTYQFLAQQFSGGRWRTVTPRNLTANDFLSGVSCVSSTFCMSTGYYGSPRGTFPLSYRWNGTSWTRLSAMTSSGSAIQ